jgi:uncharacterized protein (DUF2336 family)
MLKWVFGNKVKSSRQRRDDRKKSPRPGYEDAKRIAQIGSAAERANLAEHEDMDPEILYYFATDKAAEVRRKVAENPGTPLQADLIMAEDADEEVRHELARKIGRLVPNLSRQENQRLTDLAMKTLEILARDDLPRVRATIAEEIKLAGNVPKHLIDRLARDVEDIVAAPILEYSPLLNEQDLLDIIRGGMGEGALNAVARRAGLSAKVSDAVVDQGSVDAVALLLANTSAEIAERTLEQIATAAETRREWHRPIVDRENLPVRVVRRVAGFISAALIEQLIQRNDLEPNLVTELRQSVRRRIERGELVDQAVEESADARAKRMHDEGTLNEEALIEAIDQSETAFVRHALILKSGFPMATVNAILNTGGGKGITALAYKADLTMAMAETLQRRMGRVKPDLMLRATADGGYPLSEQDIDWYLDFFN